ncbi:MAG: hypothetical protein PHV06_07725 [bacterium]|nr:hypothetical protein [bacterium]
MRKKKQKQTQEQNKGSKEESKRLGFNMTLIVSILGILFTISGFFFILLENIYVIPALMIVAGYLLIAFSIPVEPKLKEKE